MLVLLTALLVSPPPVVVVASSMQLQGNTRRKDRLGVQEATGNAVLRDRGVDQAAVSRAMRIGNSAAILGELQRQSDHGNLIARWQLGVFYDSGEQGVVDLPRAFALIRSAADAGEPLAMTSLGVMYANGRGTPVDFRAAMQAYQRAAAAGEAHGYYGMAVLYALGQGVPINNATSFAYFLVARALDDAQADAAIRSLRPDLTAAQLRSAVRRANDLLEDAGRPERIPAAEAVIMPPQGQMPAVTTN